MSLPQSVPIESTDLTDEEVGSLVEQFTDKVPEGADRRKYKRVEYRKTAVLVLAETPDGDTSFMILTNNISRGGLAFKHSSRLEPGTPCQAKIMPSSGGSIESQGRIVRCRMLEGSGYEIGLQFDQLLGVKVAAP